MDDIHFTQIFLNLSRDPYKNSGQNDLPPQANPFTFFSTYYQAFGYPWELYNSKDAYQQYFAVKFEEEKSFATIEFEAALLFQEKKSIYINECSAILVDLLQQYSTKEKTIYDNYDSILINSVENLFVNLCRKFPLLLTAPIRDYYFFLTNIQTPLHSFKFSKHVRNDNYENLFNKHIREGGFVSGQLKPHVFKTLFNGGRLEQKINWIDHKNSLCYFIKLLNKHKVINKHEVSHWEVVAEFFLLKGNPIKREELLNQPPPLKKKRLSLENFVFQL